MTEVVLSPSNPSGSLSREALPDMQALAHWSTMLLLVGDAGRNSETAIVYSDMLRTYSGPLVITRDAIDLIKTTPPLLSIVPPRHWCYPLLNSKNSFKPSTIQRC